MKDGDAYVPQQDTRESTRSAVRTIGRGLAWNTAATILGKFLMFGNIFLILTTLSVYEYGFSELVLSIVAMAGVVFLPGLTGAVAADLSFERGRGNMGEMSRIFHQHFLFNFLLGACAWAVLFFGSHPVAEFAGNPYAAQFLQIASFTFLLSPVRAAQQMLSTVMLRFFDQSFYSIIEETFKLGFLLLFLVLLSWGLHGLMYAIVLAQTGVMLAYMPRTLSAYREFSRAPAAGKYHFWRILREHRSWSVGASYVGTLAQNARLWVVKFMLGTEAVGLFSFAMGMFSHVTSLLPLSTVLAPIVPRYVEKREQLARILRASVKFQFVLSLLSLAVALILVEPFVSILFPKYLAAVPLIRIILLAIVSNSIVTLFNPVFAAFKEQRSLLFSNVFKGFLTLVLLPPAILLFGVPGIGVEVALMTLGNGIERYLRLRRLLPEFSLDWKEIFHPDAHEREAMQMVLGAIRARLGFLAFWR